MEVTVPQTTTVAAAQPAIGITAASQPDLYALMIVVGWMLAIFIAALGLLVLYKIVRGDIQLEGLLAEPDGKASLSRFQFLIFTFVIAMSLFLIIISKGPGFPETIPGEIFALLGISGGAFLVSKGINANENTQNAQLQADVEKEQEKTIQTAIEHGIKDPNQLNQLRQP